MVPGSSKQRNATHVAAHPKNSITFEGDTISTTMTITRLPIQWELPLPSDRRRNEYWDNKRVSYLSMPDDLRTRPTCEYESDWQFSYHPSCNSLHETALNDLGNGDIKLVNNGAFRDVWRIREFDGAYRVMKTLRLIEKRKFDQRNFDRHRRDALAFEQLKQSPYVVDIYGHCGNSAVFDYCDGGDLYKLHFPNGFDSRTGESLEGEEIDSSVDKPSSKKILEVAIIVAKSVADAHNFDDKGRPTIAHTDIKPDQWIMGSDGKYRLNDFNRGRFLSWDMKRNEVCPFTVGKNPGLWRSPEEYNYDDQTEKGDVWSLGNVLYYLLTGDVPYTTMDYKEAIEHVKDGGRPEVDPVLAASTDPYQIALLRAMDGCFIVKPKRRFSARSIAEYLEAVLGGAEDAVLGGADNNSGV